MLKTIRPTDSLIILQLLVNMTGKGKIDDDGDEIRILLISSVYKKSTEASYPTFDIRKLFNYKQHAFTQAPIFQYLNPKCHIRIKTDILDYAIDGLLSQLFLDDLS